MFDFSSEVLTMNFRDTLRDNQWEEILILRAELKRFKEAFELERDRRQMLERHIGLPGLPPVIEQIKKGFGDL